MAVYCKRNHSEYPDALIREAQGLALLRSGLEAVDPLSRIRVPEVFHVDDSELQMEAIEAGPSSDAMLAMLGEGLARLHQAPQPFYGLDSNNYIGLSQQINGRFERWGHFFVKHRLGYQVRLIRNDALRQEFQAILDSSAAILEGWLDARCEQPSLLHGDLWSGNALFDGEAPWLIDPAVYFGDREADVAMTEMFGGFGAAFYSAYDDVWPRSADYPLKREIYNLYHYLNHYNLFGGGYLSGCRRGFGVLADIR
ncbi:fructosamine kinase family protein [Marinobacter lipolyticus]|uniref:fructosamine kinase family protein n=1 Tax=Marinobacter lipolyticus TaxID=209639 RepID=UPI003A91C295